MAVYFLIIISARDISGDYLFVTEIFIVLYLVSQVIPSAILHYQYYNFDRNVKLIVNRVERRMTIVSNGSIDSFGFADINWIQIGFASSWFRDGRRGFSAWEVYQYAVIEVEGGRQYLFTCLLVNNLRKFFKDLGMNPIIKRVIFPFIPFSKYPKINRQSKK